MSNFFYFRVMSETLQDENESFYHNLHSCMRLQADSGRVWVRMFLRNFVTQTDSLFVAFPSPICVENLVKIEKNPNKPLDVRGWNQLSRASLRIHGSPEITFCGLDGRIVRQMISFPDGIP